MPRRQTNPTVLTSSAVANVHQRLQTMPSLSSQRQRSSAIGLDSEAMDALSKLTVEGN